MLVKRLGLILAALVFFSFAHGQDAPSLGDIARQIRAEKEKSAKPGLVPDAPNANRTIPSGNPQPTPVQTLPATPTGAYAPYATRQEFDLHQTERYEQNVRKLFEQENFEALDQLADAARTQKSRLPGGFWAVHIAYAPLMTPVRGDYDSTEADWTTQLERLQRWMAQRPASITARVALAGAQRQYAWRARGGGYADSVSEESWRTFGERLEQAAKTLKDAFLLPNKCPEGYLLMQLMARDMGAPDEVQTSIFEKAIAFEPDYQYFYRAKAETLLPKWGGEEGDMAAFAAQIADRLSGKRGDMVYYQIATYLNCACDNDSKLYGMSWLRVKQGYIAVEEQYGESIANLNAVAYMAGVAGDRVYAEELFNRIGQGWDQNLWHKRENFDMVRNWSQGAAVEQATIAALKAAQDNLRTSDGQKFDEKIAKSFADNYSATVADCLKTSGDSFLIPFNMAVQIAKNGAVEKVFVTVYSRTSACISASVEKGVFPIPPQPDYWTNISLRARR